MYKSNEEGTIEVTLGGTVLVNTLAKVGDMVGMYMKAGVINELVPFLIKGLIKDATKVTSQAWAVGDKLWWDATNSQFTKTPQRGTNPVAVAASVVGSGSVVVGDVILLGVAEDGSQIVTTTAATVTVSAASHAGKVVVLNSTHTQLAVLPAAVGEGNKYVFVVGALGTDGSKVISALGTDVIAGVSLIAQTDTAQVNGFLTSATSDGVTLNNTTSGGIKGDRVELVDVAAGVWEVKVFGGASGTVVTPFSAQTS